MAELGRLGKAVDKQKSYVLQRVLTFPEGLKSHEIYQKVYKEKFQEPLPDDCPEALKKLINVCRAYDSFQRPSAGGKSQ